MRRHLVDGALELLAVRSSGVVRGAEDLAFETSGGANRGRYHPAAESAAAVLWVFGAGGGLGGPAGGLYHRLGSRLAPDRAASLELDYRRPGHLASCILDVRMGIEYLKTRGHDRVVLVGHSFGGAVIINTAVSDDNVIAVAALSSQTYGVQDVSLLSPRPVLFAHGEDDEILPFTCSIALFHAARQPKTLRLYPGCRHGLDQCQQELDGDLQNWLEVVLSNGAPR